MFRRDPGACPVCGQAHTACTSDSGPITVVQLPARDAMPSVPLVSEVVSLAPGQFSTATYRGGSQKARR